MVYILFVVIFNGSGAVSLKHEFKTKIDCETALHNFRMEVESGVKGFCQNIKQ